MRVRPVTARPAAGGCTSSIPAGNRNEVYTGGYWADPDREPVTWTEAEMGRAVFYYEGVVNQRFLTVHS
jgi:catechol 2,3-dioxygenase